MPRALWLADTLTDAGLKVRPYPGWETRGKTDFAPLGHMLHHTVTSPHSADLAVDKVLAVTGSSSTPAPLANISTNRDGSVSIIAAGTANHGGAGTWNGVSGNRFWIGDEMKNLGSGDPNSGWYEPWPAIQVESALRAAAACLTHIAADASWMPGHKEYATPAGRKRDPHTLDMGSLRVTVRAMMEDDMPSPKDWTPEDWAVWRDNNAQSIFEASMSAASGGVSFWLATDRNYRNINELIVAHRAGTLGTTAMAEIDDDDLDDIAKAVNDELARRAQA